jgi:site-specific recombinase XerD
MIEDMTIRNLSRSTQQSYVYAVAKFSRYFNCPPDRLGMEDVRTYQLHLIERKYSRAHINQVACALRFFYGITLGQKAAFERIVTGKEPTSFRRCSAVKRLRGSCKLSRACATGWP